MTINQFLIVLRARWRELALILALSLGAALLITAVTPRLYTATASVLVDVKSVDPLTGSSQIPQVASNYMATQMDIAQSERVIARAIQSLRLAEAPEFKFHDTWQKESAGQGSFETWVVEKVTKKLEVKPTRESGVMTLGFTAPTRDDAARVANAIMQSYIDTTLELRTQPAKNYNALFDARTKEVRAELEAAQSKLANFQREKGLVASDERLDLEATRLAELNTQLVGLQGVAAESGSRQHQADANTDRMPEVLNSPIVSSLSQELARQQAKLSELTSRLGDQHPQMQELRANIAQLRTQIERESRKVGSSMGVNNAVNQTRIAQLRASIEEQRNRVLQMRSLRDEASVLLRDVQSAQRGYDAVLGRASQVSLEAQDRQTNVSILKRAAAPAAPTSPRLGLNLSLGAVLGLMLALAWVLVREMLDRRVRSVEDIEDVLGLNLLVEIPRLDSIARRSVNARPKKDESPRLEHSPRRSSTSKSKRKAAEAALARG